MFVKNKLEERTPKRVFRTSIRSKELPNRANYMNQNYLQARLSPLIALEPLAVPRHNVVEKTITDRLKICGVLGHYFNSTRRKSMSTRLVTVED